MIILALETTGVTCGATVWESGETGRGLLSLVETYEPNVHDALLASHVQQALANCSLSIDDVHVVAVSGGPGSFTGTRIGVSFAKGLCFAGTPKLLVVDTMEALAFASREVARIAGTSDVTVVIPSHRSLYFAARYRITDSGCTRSSDDEHRINDLMSLDEAQAYASASMVIGPGARDLDQSSISGLSRLSSRFIAFYTSHLIHAAQSVAFNDPMQAEPLYRQEFNR